MFIMNLKYRFHTENKRHVPKCSWQERVREDLIWDLWWRLSVSKTACDWRKQLLDWDVPIRDQTHLDVTGPQLGHPCPGQSEILRQTAKRSSEKAEEIRLYKE